MSRKNVLINFMSIGLFLIVVACIIPGQAIQPTLATDVDSLSTFIAGTAQALAAQTEQAAVFSTPLVSPTVSATETVIPTPQLSLEKTSLEIRNDQTAVFTDYKAGIQITLPAIWLPFRIGEKEYYQVWESDFIKSDKDLLDDLSQIQTLDPKFFRLFAYDIRPNYIFNEVSSKIHVVYEADDFRTLEELFEVEKDMQEFSDHELVSNNYQQTQNGINVLVLEHRIGRTEEGKSLYYKEVLFSVSSGTVVIDFYSDFEFRDSVIADFDQVMNSIVILNQQ